MQNMTMDPSSLLALQSGRNIINIRNLTVNLNLGSGNDSSDASALQSLIGLLLSNCQNNTMSQPQCQFNFSQAPAQNAYLPQLAPGLNLAQLPQQPASSFLPQQVQQPGLPGGFLPQQFAPQQPSFPGGFLPQQFAQQPGVPGAVPQQFNPSIGLSAPLGYSNPLASMNQSFQQPAFARVPMGNPLQQMGQAQFLMQQLQAQQARQQQLQQQNDSESRLLQLLQGAAVVTLLKTLMNQNTPPVDTTLPDIAELTGKENFGNVEVQSGGQPAAPQNPVNPGNPVNAGTAGHATGDPHFTGFEGDTYDVQGQDGKIYNILSDKDVQYNAKFNSWGGSTANIISEVGLKIGQDQLYWNRDGSAPKLDGDVLEANKTYDLAKGSVKWDGDRNLVIKTDEYELTIQRQGSGTATYLDQHVKTTDKGVNFDGVLPHGLLGQTADGDGKARHGAQNATAQGEGVIDGVYTDYEVSSLYADNFRYNRFDNGNNWTGF